MASIKISDLRPAGYELFSDFENYMNEVSEEELNIQGGGTPLVFLAGAALGALAMEIYHHH